ncbi:MAG: phosphoribosylformylglycinamidine synthase I [Planctomycetes bacterium]|nr:phosphoribosylformylglycinamidine synthase I [Planctomycetota bacterium]
MTTPRALVLRAAGTNCEAETARALRLGGAEVEVLHHNRLVAEPQRLDELEIVVFAGGFSYGDDVGAGRVWGLDLRHRLAAALRAYVDRGGLALGVCNGFQVLVDSGLFGSVDAQGRRDIALTNNASNHYECRWVELEAQPCACPWIVAGERMPVPVAHAEGRFVVKDAATLARLKANGQIALVYVDPAGGEPAYPADPNGSVAHIAGLCDPTGRVLGLMPHPERNLDPWNHPRWTRLGARTEGEGLAFYRRMVATAAGSLVP